ncbi:SWIM zinc finger family protein [Nonomuraea sp. CA-143628]|uniref:SWIM zinc finger family protein n=1 Tax=Nonomuraea sp. CA-143628 TaxID=3239997 RepID=UPI003D919D69
MIERWSRDQVLALAPDASSQKAAQGVAAPGKWSLRGTTDDVLFGECKGSGATPYMACVDLSEPAYRCSCPSRKFPCKHALGLLLMWSADGVPAADSLPPWAAEWIAMRTERAAKAAAKLEAARARAAEEAESDPELADWPDSDPTPNAGSSADPSTASDLGTGLDEGSLSEGVSGTASSTGMGLGGGSGSEGGSGTASGMGLGGGPGTISGTDSGAASGPDGGLGSDSGLASGAGTASGLGVEGGRSSGLAAGDGSGLGSGASSTGRSGGGRGAGFESVRHARVSAGLAELERWLADQVRQGLAGTDADEWDDLAKRLVDAQAPGVANTLSRLREVRMADDWPSRLLAEYSLINLLAVAYRRRAELPGPLRQTVLIRAGFPVAREDVLVRPVVRDRWHVVGRRDEEHDRLTARRVWLRGHDTGRAALILSFAASGQPLDASLVTGTTIDADVAFYPGAAPLRALVATRHATSRSLPADRMTFAGQSDAAGRSAPNGRAGLAGGPDSGGRSVPDSRADLDSGSDLGSRTDLAGGPDSGDRSVPDSRMDLDGRTGSGSRSDLVGPMDPAGGADLDDRAELGSRSELTGRGDLDGRSEFAGRVPPGVSPEEALGEIAAAVTADPWTDSWPVVLAGVVPGRTSVGGFPLHPRSHDPWRLIAVSGGRPVTVAAEWTPLGLRPLTTWADDGTAVIL